MNSTAIIMAGASLLVAIISLISAIISSRHSGKSAKAIETLKHKLELERQAIKRKNKIKTDFLTALSDAIKSIQKVKDAVQKIVDSYKKGHHSQVAIQNISEASKAVFDCYEERFADMLLHKDKSDKDIFHKAKNITLMIEDNVKSILDQKDYASELSLDEKEHLRQLRHQLSDIQGQLQNSLQDQLMETLLEPSNE